MQTVLTAELTSAEDFEWVPDEEYEREHWNDKGHIEFFVTQNVPSQNLFEIEVMDYSGCAGGLNETLGIDWMIKQWGIQDELREGVTYTLHNLTVTWTRGDGWEIDDDVEYDFTHMTSHATALGYLSHKIHMIWWRKVWCHISQWRKPK